LGIGDWAQSPIPNPQSPIICFQASRDIDNNCYINEDAKMYYLQFNIHIFFESGRR
jgi:hypothetical protein